MFLRRLETPKMPFFRPWDALIATFKYERYYSRVDIGVGLGHIPVVFGVIQR